MTIAKKSRRLKIVHTFQRKNENISNPSHSIIASDLFVLAGGHNDGNKSGWEILKWVIYVWGCVCGIWRRIMDKIATIKVNIDGTLLIPHPNIGSPMPNIHFAVYCSEKVCMRFVDRCICITLSPNENTATKGYATVASIHTCSVVKRRRDGMHEKNCVSLHGYISIRKWYTQSADGMNEISTVVQKCHFALKSIDEEPSRWLDICSVVVFSLYLFSVVCMNAVSLCTHINATFQHTHTHTCA